MNPVERRSIVGLVCLYACRMLGLFMVLPVMALYGSGYVGSSAFLLGVALGVYGLTQAVLQIPLGMLSDKIGRKPVILMGMVVFLIGSLIAAQTESIYGLILGRALQGAGAVASTIMALLADLTTEQNRTKAMAGIGGSIGLAFAVAMFAGPILAGFGGLPAIFYVTAGLAMVAIAIVFRLPSPGRPSLVAARETLTVPSLIRRSLRNTELLRLDAGIFTLHLVQMASWVAVPLILEKILGVARSSHWLLYLLAMATGFIAMVPLIILAERRRRHKPVFLAGIAILGLSQLVLLESTDRFASFAFGLFLFFLAFNLLEATLPSLVSKITPAGSRGTAMGIYSSSQFLGSFSGGVLGGWLVQNQGLTAVLGFCALMTLLWLLLASSMAVPRHWSSIVVELKADAPQFDPADFTVLPGVEDVVLLAEQRLAYFKVDKQQLDAHAFDQAIGAFRTTKMAEV